MSKTVILVEVDTISPAGVAKTLRFCDRAMRPFPPTDPNRANLVWDDRLAEPPVFERSLFDDVTTLTPGRAGGGMVLKNADGGLDAYQANAWNEITVRRWTVGTAFAASQVVLHGLCAVPAYDHRTASAAAVRVDLYDDAVELDQPIQGQLYAGTNDGVAVFYEGAADGLKGRPKPIAYGDLTDAHLPAPQVNGPNMVFQPGEGPLQGSVAIFDGGAPAGYAADGDQVNATFDATTPAAAHYATNLARGLVKINGDPVLNLTFGVKGSSSPTYVETCGPVAARLLAKGGVPSARIGASVAALAGAAPIGVFAADQVNTRDLVGWVARSALAAILPDRQGVYQALPFAAPTADPVVTLQADQVLDLDPDATADAPVGEFRVGWGRIWTTFTAGELKASVRDTAEAERLAAEYRWATEVDATVKTRFPRAWRTLSIETALRHEADALALASKLKALFGLRSNGKPRRLLKVVVSPAADGMAAELGDTVRLVYAPRSIDDNFILVAEQPMRPRRDQATWTLWG